MHKHRQDKTEEQPWDEVILSEEKFILQLDIREVGVMFTMLSSNLAQEHADTNKTLNETLKIAEKFIKKWKNTRKKNSP